MSTLLAGMTMIDNGMIVYVPPNTPRYQAGQLLVEAASTNLLRYSEQIQNVAWVKANATVTPNAIVAPDGSLTADKLIETAVNSTHFTYQQPTTVAGTYTLSAFIRLASDFLHGCEYKKMAYLLELVFLTCQTGQSSLAQPQAR